MLTQRGMTRPQERRNRGATKLYQTMKWNDVFCNTFKAMTAQLGLPPEDKSLPEISRADDSDFCQEILIQGWLSEAQLHRAACRYRLAKSRSGRSICGTISGRAFRASKRGEWSLQTTLLEPPNTSDGTTKK